MNKKRAYLEGDSGAFAEVGEEGGEIAVAEEEGERDVGGDEGCQEEERGGF